MCYDLSNLPLRTLLTPVSEASGLLQRLDERIARSPVGEGWLQRMQFADACASLWIDGGIVPLEDLVLHDAETDTHAPSHDLAIARDVLKTRRRIMAQPADWALGATGLRSLLGQGTDRPVPPEGPDHGTSGKKGRTIATTLADDEGSPDPLDGALAAIDLMLARSDAALAKAAHPATGAPRARDPLIYEPDWDEDARLAEWRAVLGELGDLPPILKAIVALDAWNRVAVSQHKPWLGRLLVASILRQSGMTTASHLVAVNLGLKAVSIDRRRHRDRDTRLTALLAGIRAAVDLGFKEHDRLSLAGQTMGRRLQGRRMSSNLPALVDLVLQRPLVTTTMVADALTITPQAALRLINELNLREMTGRGRYRAWGII